MKINILAFDLHSRTLTFNFDSIPNPEWEQRFISRLANLGISFTPSLTSTYEIVFKRESLISTFLMDMKKFFLDAGITPENWIEVESRLLGQAQLAPSTTLLSLPYQLQYMIADLDGLVFRSKMLVVNRELNNNILTEEDYEQKFQAHFPDHAEELRAHALEEKDKEVKINFKKNWAKECKTEFNNLSFAWLWFYFKEGNWEAIKKYIIEDWSYRRFFEYSYEVTDNKGYGLLDWAIRNGHQHICNSLYDLHTTGIKARDGNFTIGRHSLLQLAIFYRQPLDTLKTLVIQGENVNHLANQNYYDMQTALVIAVATGQSQIVQYLCEEKDFSHLNHRNVKGETALHRAVYRKQVECVKILCAQEEIDLRVRERYNETALYWAIEKNLELTRIVWEAHIAKNQLDDDITRQALKKAMDICCLDINRLSSRNVYIYLLEQTRIHQPHITFDDSPLRTMLTPPFVLTDWRKSAAASFLGGASASVGITILLGALSASGPVGWGLLIIGAACFIGFMALAIYDQKVGKAYLDRFSQRFFGTSDRMETNINAFPALGLHSAG